MNLTNASVDKEARIRESFRIRAKYMDKVPVIIECEPHLDKLLKKHKFLCPRDLSCSNFLYILRGKMPAFDAKQALYMYADGKLLTGNTLLGSIDDQRDDKSDMLIVRLQVENAFGCI